MVVEHFPGVLEYCLDHALTLFVDGRFGPFVHQLIVDGCRLVFFGCRDSPLGQPRRLNKLSFDRIVIGPDGRQTIEIPTDPELDRRTLERIAKRRFHAIAAIRLFAG